MKSSERLPVNQPDFVGWIFDILHLGLVIVDDKTHILAVNKWFEQRADLDFPDVCNRPLVDVFPELRGGRLERAVNDAIKTGCAAVLSQSLNRAPFPLYPPLPNRTGAQAERLRQAIQVMPKTPSAGGALVVIQIEDVTASVRRENLLRQQADQLQYLAYIDGLTGVANRRRFGEFLAAEIARAKRSMRPMSLIMFDIDHFKQYNDSHGHQEGDRCIVRVAQAAQRALKRPADLLARYGGDEFAIILSETDHIGALVVAEEIRQQVLNMNLGDGGIPGWTVTISLGVGSGYPGRGLSMSGLIALADQALYQSKAGGRNASSVQRAPI